jgi:hypothetical protein
MVESEPVENVEEESREEEEKENREEEKEIRILGLKVLAVIREAQQKHGLRSINMLSKGRTFMILLQMNFLARAKGGSVDPESSDPYLIF